MTTNGWMQILCVALALFAVVNSIDQTYFTVRRIRAFAALPDEQRTGMQFDPGTFGPGYQAVARLVPDGATLAYGNSVAVPCVFFILAGIVWAAGRELSE